MLKMSSNKLKQAMEMTDRVELALTKAVDAKQHLNDADTALQTAKAEYEQAQSLRDPAEIQRTWLAFSQAEQVLDTAFKMNQQARAELTQSIDRP